MRIAGKLFGCPFFIDVDEDGVQAFRCAECGTTSDADREAFAAARNKNCKKVSGKKKAAKKTATPESKAEAPKKTATAKKSSTGQES